MFFNKSGTIQIDHSRFQPNIHFDIQTIQMDHPIRYKAPTGNHSHLEEKQFSIQYLI